MRRLRKALRRPRVDPPPALPARVARWLANEDGDSLPYGAVPIREHDPSCPTLAGAWLPRRGGFTDMCALEDCPGCGTTFDIDSPALHFEPDGTQKYLGEGDEDWYDAYWCDCCWRGRAAGAGGVL